MNAKLFCLSAVTAAVIVGCVIVPENRPADTAPPPPPTAAAPTATTTPTAPAPTTPPRPVLKAVPRADAGVMTDGG